VTEEKLFLTKPNYCCVQYMANTPDKFRIKFWLALDVKSKCSLICFPYLSKDELRPADRLQASILCFVLCSLVWIRPKCQNVFDIFIKKLATDLKQTGESFVGNINLSRSENPPSIKNTSGNLY